jgi:CheY-like chemotaxis protein
MSTAISGVAPRSGPILIVDDDVDIREVLTETLVGYGYEVAAAANGLDAIRLIGAMAVPPAAILLDLMMPTMDGYGFLEERRRHPQLKSIPVAVISAGRSVDEQRLDRGTPVVPKPFNLPKLLDVLHALTAKVHAPA